MFKKVLKSHTNNAKIMPDPKAPTDPVGLGEESHTVRDGVNEQAHSRQTTPSSDENPLSSRLQEIAEMTARIQAETDERTGTAAIDLSFIDQVYRGYPKSADKVRHYLSDALKTLEERKDFIFQARERAAMAYFAEREKIQADMMRPPTKISLPTAGEVSCFMAPAITEFLQIRLRQDEFDVRTSLAFSGKTAKGSTRKPIHWVTVISFRTANPRGGFNTVNNDEFQLFVDAADKMPSKKSRITVAPVSEIRKHGLEIFDPQNNEHVSNHGAIQQISLGGRSNIKLDQHGHLVFRVMEATSTLGDLEKFPDLYADALLKAMEHGNMPSDAIMAKLFARWKKG
jgi:hypothetical protein